MLSAVSVAGSDSRRPGVQTYVYLDQHPAAGALLYIDALLGMQHGQSQQLSGMLEKCGSI